MSKQSKQLIVYLLIALAFFGLRHAFNQWQQQSEQSDYQAETVGQAPIAVTNPLETSDVQTTEASAETTTERLTTSAQSADSIADLVAIGLIEEISNGNKVVGWRSPAGLFYGMGSREGNRLYHVFAHLEPDDSKPVHSVFDTDKAGLVQLLDEAWRQRDSAYTEAQSNGNRIYDIDMGRVIGTTGEREIRLVVRDGSDNIITAYPRR